MSAPVVTRYLVQQTGHYTSALIVAGVVALCGLVAWLLIVPEGASHRLGGGAEGSDATNR
jgi:hypothetical protein